MNYIPKGLLKFACTENFILRSSEKNCNKLGEIVLKLFNPNMLILLFPISEIRDGKPTLSHTM